MQRRVLVILSLLFLLPIVFLAPKVFAQAATYTVSGYVFDDLNANGRYDVGEPGLSNVMIYADNTYSHRAYTDRYGYYRMEVPFGSHSIEIPTAKSYGSKPTTSEKVTVTGSNTAVDFGVQYKGYAVEGYVRDERGIPIAGAEVFVDIPNRQSVRTNASGYYRIEDVGYDESPVIWGVQGGHNISISGYQAESVYLNPQNAIISEPANFIVRTNQTGPGCGPVYARDPSNVYCAYFENRCYLPAGWIEVASCNQMPPVDGGDDNQESYIQGYQQEAPVIDTWTPDASSYQFQPVESVADPSYMYENQPVNDFWVDSYFIDQSWDSQSWVW